ncbi:MAG: DUF4185 domain-containing protein [Alphaproteobacteria bacterium]
MKLRLAALAAALTFCLSAPGLANGGPGPEAAAHSAVAPAAQACAPYFPLRDGWLGGDAAYSVALPGGQTLWLFGDTFIGEPGAATRRDADLIANSVALSACRAGEWSIRYHWRNGEAPAAVFTPPDATSTTHEVRYWPMDGFVRGDTLYVFLSRVRMTERGGPLGFAIEGVDLARIENPGRPPAQWKISYSPVLRGEPALPGAAVLPREDHVLLYTPLTGKERKERPVALARLPWAGLHAPAEHLQFLARDGAWRKGFAADEAQHIMDRGATELSVQETEDGAFVSVLNESVFPAERIVLRTAPAPEGPWTEELAVTEIGERAGADEARRARVFCYAAKAWEPATRGTSLMLTYVCNSMDAELLLNDLGLYRPRVKRVTLPEGL